MRKLLMLTMLSAGCALAAPSAYPEKVLELSYGFTNYTTLATEIPFSVDGIADTTAEARFSFSSGAQSEANLDLAVKALLLPSLTSEPTLSLAVRADLGLNSKGWQTHAGPLLSLDLSPVTVNFGLYPGLGNTGWDLNYQANVQYKLDGMPLTLDVGLFNSRFTVGARYAF